MGDATTRPGPGKQRGNRQSRRDAAATTPGDTGAAPPPAVNWVGRRALLTLSKADVFLVSCLQTAC